MSEWSDTRRVFADAAAWFVDVAAQVGGRWDEPGLGEWDVRALVGHTSRSLLTVEAYLAMRLSDYLPTRTFELVVHTLDLARALGLRLEPPPAAATAALHLAVDLAVAGDAAGTLLLTATGRGAPPAGFSVL